MKFLTIGISELDESLFKSIKNNTTKPIGGLWATKYIPNYSLWIDYVCKYPDFLDEKYGKFGNNIPCIIWTLKSDANIFILDSVEKLEYLKKTYPDGDWFDFEALANHYDGINIIIRNFKELKDDPFKNYGIDATILFNLQAIEYTEKANITIEEIRLPYNTIYEHFITTNNSLKRTKPSI